MPWSDDTPEEPDLPAPVSPEPPTIPSELPPDAQIEFPIAGEVSVESDAISRGSNVLEETKMPMRESETISDAVTEVEDAAERGQAAE